MKLVRPKREKAGTIVLGSYEPKEIEGVVSNA